jgi:hypothetical protein
MYVMFEPMDGHAAQGAVATGDGMYVAMCLGTIRALCCTEGLRAIHVLTACTYLIEPAVCCAWGSLTPGSCDMCPLLHVACVLLNIQKIGV